MRRILIDFYCGGGGAGMGYHWNGFEVIGIDKDPQPNYPFRFIQADVFDFGERMLAGGTWDWIGPGVISAMHGSPPCQHDSGASKSHNGRPETHPDLIAPTQALFRELSDRWGMPYVIENVSGARHKLRDPIMLCGTMFPGLRVTRHRYFECSGFTFTPPPHGKHPLHYTRDKRKPHYGKLDEMTDFVMVNGGGNCSKAAAADAMGIDWMKTKHELNEAIPPAYTRHIGAALMGAIS